MKRIIFFALLLTFAATGTFAQEIQLPYPSTTALSYEKTRYITTASALAKKIAKHFSNLTPKKISTANTATVGVCILLVGV